MADYGRIQQDGYVETPQYKTVTMRISLDPERELYAKFSDGTEKQLTGVSISQINNNGFSSSWLGVTDKGASQDSLYQLLLAKYGRVWFFTSDSSQANTFGEVGNLLQPTGMNQVGNVVNSFSLPGDVFVFIGGTYSVSTFLIPKKDQTFIFINSILNSSAFNGAILGLNSNTDLVNRAENVSFIGIGKSQINKTNTSTAWGWLSVYNYFTGDFNNLTINTYGIIDRVNVGASKAYLVKMISCIYNILDTPVTSADTGRGMTGGMIQVEDCTITGLFTIAGTGSDYGYMLKAYRTKFIYADMPSSDLEGNMTIFTNATFAGQDVYIKDCEFQSDFANILNRTNVALYVSTRQEIIDSCNFVNGVEGWVENQVTTQPFKLTPNSLTKNAPTGEAVVNTYLGAGISVEPNLQIG